MQLAQVQCSPLRVLLLELKVRHLLRHSHVDIVRRLRQGNLAWLVQLLRLYLLRARRLLSKSLLLWLHDWHLLTCLLLLVHGSHLLHLHLLECGHLVVLHRHAVHHGVLHHLLAHHLLVVVRHHIWVLECHLRHLVLHHHGHGHLLRLLELLARLLSRSCLLGGLLQLLLVECLWLLLFVLLFDFLLLLLLDGLLLSQLLLGLHVLLELLVQHVEHVIVGVLGLGDNVAVLIKGLNGRHDWHLLLDLSLWLRGLLLVWLRLSLCLWLLLLVLGFILFGLSVSLSWLLLQFLGLVISLFL